MRFSYSIVASSVMTMIFSGLVLAQEIDNTQTLPNAKAGECYAKVITPAQFSIQEETVIIQAASETVQTLPAKYETVEQTVVVKEGSQNITAVPAQFEDSVERIEIKPAMMQWITSGTDQVPASPAVLDAIIRSGVDLDTVEPSTCFREYYTPIEFKTETQQVLIAEGSEQISVVPASYEIVEERVVVKEASSQVVDVPATYKTVDQQILVEPAKTVWKQGRGPVERIDNTTGEIMCLVEVPARYETITKTVLDRAATTKRIEVPAVYKTIKVKRLVKAASETRTPIPPKFETVTSQVKVADPSFYWLVKGEKPAGSATYSGNEVCLLQSDAEYTTVKTKILKSPSTVKVVEIAPQYETIRVNRLVSAATERRIPVPEKTKVITKRVQTAPSRLEWRRILCETNISSELIVRLQKALEREGFPPGKIDGVLGNETTGAVEAYQLKNNLDRGGLTYETLGALKIEP